MALLYDPQCVASAHQAGWGPTLQAHGSELVFPAEMASSHVAALTGSLGAEASLSDRTEVTRASAVSSHLRFEFYL